MSCSLVFGNYQSLQPNMPFGSGSESLSGGLTVLAPGRRPSKRIDCVRTAAAYTRIPPVRHAATQNAHRWMDCAPNNARHAQITGTKPWYELAGQAANQIDLGRNSNQIEPRVISARRLNTPSNLSWPPR